ncbi:hypothetical protein CKA32_001609 [Geitlerinema sp. FC II]|nr:hypothetical protein CKA32_001609 [Geitlerinema sp. FC II]
MAIRPLRSRSPLKNTRFGTPHTPLKTDNSLLTVRGSL